MGGEGRDFFPSRQQRVDAHKMPSVRTTVTPVAYQHLLALVFLEADLTMQLGSLALGAEADCQEEQAGQCVPRTWAWASKGQLR